VSTPLTPAAAPALDAAGGIGTDTRRLASKANLDKAGQQFEAVFMRMMLKSMRQPHLAQDLFGSKAGDTFREMQDGRFADLLAGAQPMGIGKAVSAFLAKANPDLSETS